MNLGIIALLVLILIIAIGFFRKLNVGLLAMGAAVILGYASGQFTKAEIQSGFSPSLFLTLFGLTLLIGIVTSNGSLDQIMRRIINKVGNKVWLIPIVMFVSAWLVSFVAGGFAGMAFICSISVPVIRVTGYNPIMLMIIGNAGAQCGRYSKIAPDGNIVLTLLAEQGINGGTVPLTINMTIAMILLSVMAFIFFKGYKHKNEGDVKLETQPITTKQWITLAGFVCMVISVIGFGMDAGLMSLTIAVILITIGVVDEKTAFNSVPWNTIMMVVGVGVLMKIVLNAGGIDILTTLISKNTNEVTASGASCLMSGIMSWFSSTLGVVVPTLTPTVGTIVEQIGGSLTPIGLLSSMLIGSSSACFSPASSVGGLILALISGDAELGKDFDAEKGFVTMFLWSVAMVIISSLLSLAGLYNIFH